MRRTTVTSLVLLAASLVNSCAPNDEGGDTEAQRAGRADQRSRENSSTLNPDQREQLIAMGGEGEARSPIGLLAHTLVLVFVGGVFVVKSVGQAIADNHDRVWMMSESRTVAARNRCGEKGLAKLKSQQGALCHSGNSCKGNDSCEVLSSKLGMNSRCADKRKEIADKCFGGFDEKHKIAHDDVLAAIGNCEEWLRKKKCIQ